MEMDFVAGSADFIITIYSIIIIILSQDDFSSSQMMTGRGRHTDTASTEKLPALTDN